MKTIALLSSSSVFGLLIFSTAQAKDDLHRKLELLLDRLEELEQQHLPIEELESKIVTQHIKISELNKHRELQDSCSLSPSGNGNKCMVNRPLEVIGDLTVQDSLKVKSVSVFGDAAVRNNATLKGDIAVDGSLMIEGSFLFGDTPPPPLVDPFNATTFGASFPVQFGSDVKVYGSVSVEGDATLTGNVVIPNQFVVQGNMIVDGNVQFDDELKMKDYVTMEGSSTIIDVPVTVTGEGKLEPGKNKYQGQKSKNEVSITGTVSVFDLVVNKGP